MRPAPVLLLFLLLFVGGLAGLRMFMAWTESWTYGSNIWAKVRIHGSLAALSEPSLQDSNVVLFLGASEAMAGFNPMEFDFTNKKAKRPTVSLNMAVHNIGTFLPLYFDRIALELERAKLRPKIIFVNFPISRLTTAARRHYIEMQRTHDLPSAYFDLALWNSVGNFQEASGLAVNKWVFGERTPLQVPLLFSRAFRKLTHQTTQRPDQNLMNALLEKPERAWMARGRFYSGVAENAPGVFASKNYTIHEGGLEEMAAQNSDCCDFHDLHIDERYANEVLGSLDKLRALTDHLVVVHLAENRLYPRSPESEGRRHEFLLKAGHGEEPWSFAYPPYEYIDLLHLSPRGSVVFSTELAAQVPDEWLKTGSK